MAWLFALWWCSATGAVAQFHFAYEPGSRVWTLRNGLIEAVFRLRHSGNFQFERLADLRSGQAWTSAWSVPSAPFRLLAGNDTLDARTPFRLASQFVQAIPRGGYRQTIVLHDLTGLGQLTLELEMYANQPVLRHQTRFRNLRPTTVRVRAADMLPWTFTEDGQNFRVMRVNQWVHGGALGNFEPLVNTLNPQGGAITLLSGAYGQHCGWLAVRSRGNNGLFAGWEFDGRASASVWRDRRAGSLQLSASILELNHPVERHEDFLLPAAFLGLFRGDWDEAGYRTQRFTEAVLAPPLPDHDFPWLVWNSWRYLTRIDETTLRRNAELAAKLGFELFIVDLGWAQQIGNWRAHPRKFPRGLRPLSDYVHSLGMKFGLHLALAEAAPSSPVLRVHPDWTSSNTYGYFDAVSLCLSHQPVKQWLVEEVVRVIDEYNVDWILQDGENMVKRCTKTSHTHDPLDSNYSNAVEGLNAVIAEIQRRRPRVLWENCEDGGNMMTFNMVKHYVTSIGPDDSGPLTTRQAVYGALYPFSPRYSSRYMWDENLTLYTTRSFMFGGPWVFMNRLAEMTPQDLTVAASEIQLYKSLRRHIRDGKVLRLTPRPAADRVDALQSYVEATDSAVVMVLRGEADISSQLLRLRGLKPAQNYRVRFQENSRDLTFTGAQLMEQGVPVDLADAWHTEIVYVEPLRP